MTPLAEFNAWLSSENAGRKREGAPPLTDDSPVVCEKRLATVTYRQWSAKSLVERHRWFLDGYINGYVLESVWKSEVAAFVKEARSLIALQEFMDVMSRPRTERQLTEKEQQRRNEWLAHEQARQTRMEQQRQRRLLREGQATMTAIRRVLRGQDPSPQPASTLGKSSPTS